MTDQFIKPFTKMFEATSLNQLPEQTQAIVHDGLAKTRDAALKSIAAVKVGAEALGKASPIAAKETGAFTTRAFEQAIENTEAAFVAAQAIFSARSPVEAAQVHATYVQAQLSKVGEQAKELFNLSTKVAQGQFAGINATAKSFAPVKG